MDSFLWYCEERGKRNLMAENMMSPDHKAVNQNYRDNYDETFRNPKKDKEKDKKDKQKD